eukprot:651117-Amphidinium_carterae.1
MTSEETTDHSHTGVMPAVSPVVFWLFLRTAYSQERAFECMSLWVHLRGLSFSCRVLRDEVENRLRQLVIRIIRPALTQTSDTAHKVHAAHQHTQSQSQKYERDSC